MPGIADDRIRFRRNQFSARFPTSYLYSLAHYWLCEDEPGGWRVGFTNFATRMLGEIVEFDFEVKSGETINVAQCLGWIEGFKAVSDVLCVGEGEFLEFNAAAADDPAVICKDPYVKGWLYRFRGAPDPGRVDVQGYIEHLELTIDKMLEQPWKSPGISEGNAGPGSSNS